MSSGIFAVANIGKYRLYIGETHTLKERWAKILALLSRGTFPSSRLQQEWHAYGEQRRFTFHTAQELEHDTQLVGHGRFLKDASVRLDV